MKRTFNPEDKLATSCLFVYREILGYPPMPTISKGSRDREKIKSYISKCVSENCAPKLIISNRGREREVTCMITDVKTTEFTTLYYMLNFFRNKNNKEELLILAVPSDPDSISPPCILCEGNKDGKYKQFDPFSQATTDDYNKFCEEQGW